MQILYFSPLDIMPRASLTHNVNRLPNLHNWKTKEKHGIYTCILLVRKKKSDAVRDFNDIHEITSLSKFVRLSFNPSDKLWTLKEITIFLFSPLFLAILFARCSIRRHLNVFRRMCVRSDFCRFRENKRLGYKGNRNWLWLDFTKHLPTLQELHKSNVIGAICS